MMHRIRAKSFIFSACFSLVPCLLSIAGHADCGSTTSPTGSDFVNNQVYLLSSADAKQTFGEIGKSYKHPICATHLTSSSPYADALSKAFDAAPDAFKSELCNLSCVFVTACAASTCTIDDLTTGSWGYRERPDQKPGDGRYVATSAGFWDSKLWPTGAPPSLHQFETTLLSALISWPSNSNPPNFSPAQPDDTSPMTVLAALAHEFGHLLWYDTFRPTRGGPFDFLTFCRGSFFDNSWQRVNPPPTWRNFGEVQDSHHIYDPAIADLALAIGRAKSKQAAQLLDQIYRPRAPWPSLFGAFSPDEDFVETFKLYVLTTAKPSPLVSLQINIYDDSSSTPKFTEDIPDALIPGKNKKGELKRKLECIGSLVNPP